MNVSLTPELDRYVAMKLEQGTYASQSEVVRAGLRLLIERERLIEARISHGVPEQLQLPPERLLEPSPTERARPDGQAGGTPVPRSLWPHFPEYDPSRLTLEQHRDTIIARLLGLAHPDATRWLRSYLPASELAAFLRSREGLGLDPKSLRFWGMLLDLPAEEVDRWVESARRGPWASRVAR